MNETLESARQSGWELFPGIALGEQSIMDTVSIVNDNADYAIEVRTLREKDGSILWVMRGLVDEYIYVSRDNLVDDIERAVSVLDEMDNDIDYLNEQGAFLPFQSEPATRSTPMMRRGALR